MERLLHWKNAISERDNVAEEKARARWDAIAKPLDSLGELERIITRIAGIQGSAGVEITPAALYIFCADNGIVKEGVAQSDPTVTAAVAQSMAKGNSCVCRMARVAGVETIPVDIGMLYDVEDAGIRKCRIRRGTRDFLEEPAMTMEETLAAIECGKALAEEAAARGVRMLLTGEMGIGNTTTAAALSAGLTGISVTEVCGRGAGLDDSGLARKRSAISEGLRRYGFAEGKELIQGEEALRLLSCLGGLDIAGLTGLYIGAACCRIPIIIDGVIAATAALLAERLTEGARHFMLASHAGREPAMEHILKLLGQRPIIHADLALGEGSGAVMLMPLLSMALAVYHGETSFAELSMEPYRRYEA